MLLIEFWKYLLPSYLFEVILLLYVEKNILLLPLIGNMIKKQNEKYNKEYNKHETINFKSY